MPRFLGVWEGEAAMRHLMRCQWLVRTGLVAAALLTGATPAIEAAETPGTHASRISCLGVLDNESIRSRPIRLARRDGTTVAGRILSLNEGSVTIAGSDPLAGPREVREEEIVSIGYSIPTGPRKSYVGIGAVIGSCLGFLIGYYASDPDKPDADDFFTMSEEDQRSLNGGVGMVLGAGLGALFGLAASSEPVEDREFTCAH